MAPEHQETDKRVIRWDGDSIKALLDTANSLIICLDEDAGIVVFNRECERLTGYSRDEVIGRSWTEIFLPEHLYTPQYANFAEWVRDHPEGRFEYPLLTKSGEVKTILWSGAAEITHASNQFLAVVIGHDITDLKTAEAALKKSETRYRAIIEDQTDLVIRFRPDKTLSFVNEAYAHFRGFKPEEMVGRKIFDFIPAEDHEEFRRFFDRMGPGRQVDDIQRKVRNTEGDVCWHHWNCRAILDDHGELSEIQAVGRDITRQIQADKKQSECEKHFRDLAELLPGGVFEVDLEGRLTFANKVLYDYFGYTLEEFERGINIRQGLIAEDRIRMLANVGRILNGEILAISEYTGVTKTGKRFPILLNSAPIYKNGRICGLRGMIIDITERKFAEQLQIVLYRIAGAVSLTNDLTEFFETIRTELSAVIDTSNFFIALYDKEKDHLSLTYLADEYDSYLEAPAGKKLTAYVIRNDRPLLANEEDVEKLVKAGEVEHFGSRSKIWLGVPLKIGSAVIGAVVVQHYTDPNAYTKKDMEVLQFVSGQIAVAIERKRSEEALQKAHDGLEIRVSERTAELTDANRRLQEQIDHRLRTENALRESEQRYALAASAGRVGVWDWDLVNDKMYVDSNLKSMIGYAEHELDSSFEQFTKLVHPDDVDIVIATGEIHLEGKTGQYECEHRMRHKNGNYIWVLSRGSVFRDSRGKPYRMIGTHIDITERIEADTKLRQTADELSQERKNLTEKNIAMNQILDHIESSRQKYQAGIVQSVEDVLAPLLDKLTDAQSPVLKMEIDEVLNQLKSISDNERVISDEIFATLTPRESEICKMIRSGLSSKSISDCLKLSVVTVHKHREKIRKKLGLTNKRINLSSYLKSN